jgi:hypothetical protein
MHITIAVAREQRDNVPSNWQDQLAKIEGVKILGRNAIRVTASVTPESLSAVNKLLGGFCHVETVVDRLPS